MKKTSKIIQIPWAILCIILTHTVLNAEPPILPKISAVKAFNSYVKQRNPDTKRQANVVLIDVRTASEYFWLGTGAKVDTITMKNGKHYKPYNGKVLYLFGESILHFRIKKPGYIVKKVIFIGNIESIAVSPITTLIPYKFWDPINGDFTLNDNFVHTIETNYSKTDDVIILFCRSGKRSSPAGIDLLNAGFKHVYEIDSQIDGNHGGFQGSTYGNVYNGYRGFPKRRTGCQRAARSVSWSDAGLPIIIGDNPYDP